MCGIFNNFINKRLIVAFSFLRSPALTKGKSEYYQNKQIIFHGFFSCIVNMILAFI